MWDHFRAVSAPAIIECQAVQEEGTDEATIVQTAVEYARYCKEKRANSEVAHVLCIKHIL